MLKKSFHKFLIITPLLGLIFFSFSGINNFIFEQDQQTSFVQNQKNTIKSFTFIQESNDCLDFFFEESELEDNFEIDYFSTTAFSENYTSLVTEKQKLCTHTNFCFKQKSKPLYDLYCKWKHHLS